MSGTDQPPFVDCMGHKLDQTVKELSQRGALIKSMSRLPNNGIWRLWLNWKSREELVRQSDLLKLDSECAATRMNLK